MNDVSFEILGEAILVGTQQDKIRNHLTSCNTSPNATVYTPLGRPDNSAGCWYNLLLMILMSLVVTGLRAVLTLGACLLSLVQWPTAMSAPTRAKPGIPQDHPRLWVNPCGFSQQPGGEENSDPISEQISIEQMLDTIIVQVKNAITSVDEFKINYVSSFV